MWGHMWQTAAVFFTLPLPSYTDVWNLAVFRSVADTVSCDALGQLRTGDAYSQYQIVTSDTAMAAVAGGPTKVAEWHNLVMAGTRFAHRNTLDVLLWFFLYTENEAHVTVRANGSVVEEMTVSPGSSLFDNIPDTRNTEVEIESSTEVNVAPVYPHEGFAPLPPVAKTIYGNCPESCSISIWGGDTSIPIERTCTDGSTVQVQAGLYTGTSDYGESCKWTAPDGYLISGATTRDLPGTGSTSEEISVFTPAEYFYPIVPLPAKFSILILISTGPAVCNYDGNTVNLAGASGVYHARLTDLERGFVISCDMPVVAMGDAQNEQYDSVTAAMTLIMAPMPTTTTTTTGTTTTNTATATTTTSLSSSTTSSATTTTSSATVTTSSLTTSTTTVTTTTNTTITVTTSSSSSSTTTTSVTTSMSTTETATTTTLTATRSTTTATTTTSTPTATTSSTTTSTTTTSITPTSTTTTSTTSTSTISTTSSFTTTTSTTRTSSTTSTKSTTQTTTISATTATMTTPTITTSTATTTTTSSTNTTLTTSTTTSSNTSTVTSATLSATNTTMSSTATVSTTSANDLSAVALLNRVETLEASLLTSLTEGNLTTVVQRADGLTLLAARLDAAAVAATGGSLTVPLEDSEGAAVTVPASLFPSLGLGAQGVVLTIAKADVTAESFTGTGSDAEVQVASVINVNLLSLAGRHLNVSGLVDPIKVVMPVNESSGLQCVFWDEGSSTWATAGVELGEVNAGTVECTTTHLSLFAAIVRGFVKALACSQVSLLNPQSMKELGKGGWHSTFGASVFWCLLAAFVLLMLLAAWVDRRRWRQGKSSDELLLVPLQDRGEDAGQEEQPQEEDGGEANTGWRWVWVCASGCVVGGACWLMEWCRSSGALRDAMDEVFSQWAENFGEIRDLVEGLVEGLDLCGAPTAGRIALFVHRLGSKTLFMLARRQVAASLGISWDVSELVMTDEHMNEVVQAHRERPSSQGLRRGASATTLVREEAWGKLHRDIEVKLDTVMLSFAHWSSLPRTVWCVFLHQNPFSACLVHCAFTSCKLRVLFFVVDVVGSLMLSSVFFSSTGVQQKGMRRLECDTEDSMFEFVGRTLAVGTASVIFGGIPAIILGSLCTREPKKFDYEGCPEWNRQLKAWRIQDRAIWVLGSSYVAFCVFFISLFLANVDREDHGEWLMSGLLSVVQCTVLMPMAMALTLPLMVTACLQIMSWHRRVTKEQIVCELHLQFKQDANMAATVGTI